MSELYNKKFENYDDEYNELSDVKKDKLDQKPINLKLKDYNYDGWFTKKWWRRVRSPLEGNKEVKEGKRLKIVAPNKFLTRLPILLTQIKAGNNSYKL